jgi:hypothetical protein
MVGIVGAKVDQIEDGLAGHLGCLSRVLDTTRAIRAEHIVVAIDDA